ncbi:MAG: excinuclease ABC subunit UvrC [Dehalococcoidia bacterium]|nr:excinuclease ABC subunit UvrC [Dehalococcoidia bacterium]
MPWHAFASLPQPIWRSNILCSEAIAANYVKMPARIMPTPIKAIVTERLSSLPESPGVYLMKDAAGKVIYVGKAGCLRSRVRSYFNDSDLTPKTVQLVRRINDIDFYVTRSEEEALILELNLIKRFRPEYNIRLKDDKGYPYIKIDLNEDWPRVQVVRCVASDGARYFGPFASAYSIRQALDVAKSIFPFRTCNTDLNQRRERPCLEYDMRHCLAPCTGQLERKEYSEIIQGVIQFLDGKHLRLEQSLMKRMKQSAEAQHYEAAARLRDQIKAMREVVAWQRVATRVRGDADAAAFVQNGDQAFVQVFFIRGGKLLGREGFLLQGTNAEEPSATMGSFVMQYYAVSQNIPPLILLQHPAEGESVIKEWLTRKRGGAVRLAVPKRGPRKELMETVQTNAQRALEQLRIKHLSQPQALGEALEELKAVLRLPETPQRIEGYDISNIQGQLAVGSMVVFEEGRPRPSHYRRFRIKTIQGANDYAMMEEMLRRRFARAKDGQGEGNWAALPGLVLIDGGKGQLRSACTALEAVEASMVPVASLAKEHEEIFVPGLAQPIRLSASSPGRQLLQRVRDEAHRFALGYHTNLRKRQTFASTLDNVPGIGPRRKKALLKNFGSVARLREATVDEIAAQPLFNAALARKIKECI